MADSIWLIRHGETEWSRSGAHTGRSDIRLTEHGQEQARQVRQALAGNKFSLVLSSPMGRALDTCKLAGFGENVEVDQRLQEWDYGDYEGKSTQEIRKAKPDWLLWRDGVPHGEKVEQVGARADAVIERIQPVSGEVAIFSHGHFLRIFTSRWLGLEADCGRLFALDTATISVLGFERETHVIKRWNTPAL